MKIFMVPKLTSACTENILEVFIVSKMIEKSNIECINDGA